MSRFSVGLFMLALCGASNIAADSKPMERKTDDRQMIDMLASIHDRGAMLFNSGDHAGSYRLFQGSLMTVRLVLPKELQAIVDRGLAQAEAQPDYVHRAMTLHALIEEVRKKLHPTAGQAEKLGQPRKADPMGTADLLKAPETIETSQPPKRIETTEPPKAPAVSPKPKIDAAPPPILKDIPTSNPKRPMPPPEGPSTQNGLTVPPRPATPSGSASSPPAPLPGPVRPASASPDLVPLPPPMPPKKANSSAPPPLIAPGK